MPDAPEVQHDPSTSTRARSHTPSYAEVLSTSPVTSEPTLGVTTRHHTEFIRSERATMDDGMQAIQDIDHEELFMFEESLRRGDAAQASRRRTSNMTTSDTRRPVPSRSQEVSGGTVDWSSVFPDPWSTVGQDLSLLPTIIHPHAPAAGTRSPSPDELALLPNHQARRSLSLLSQTSARRSESIFFPASPERRSARRPNNNPSSGSNSNSNSDNVREVLRSLYNSAPDQPQSREQLITPAQINPEDPFAFLLEDQPRLVLRDGVWVPVQLTADGNAGRVASVSDQQPARRRIVEESLPPFPSAETRRRFSRERGGKHGSAVLLLYCGNDASATSGPTTALPGDFYYVDSTPSTSTSTFISPTSSSTQPRGGCGALICTRGILDSADPDAYESDCPPLPQVTDWLHILPGERTRDQRGHAVRKGGKQCTCIRGSIGCRNCGNELGYATIRPCKRCTQLHGTWISYFFYKSTTSAQNRKIRYATSIPRAITTTTSVISDTSSSQFEGVYLSWPSVRELRNTSGKQERSPGQIKTRDVDIQAELAGDPVEWAEKGRELFRAHQAGGEASPDVLRNELPESPEGDRKRVVELSFGEDTDGNVVHTRSEYRLEEEDELVLRPGNLRNSIFFPGQHDREEEDQLPDMPSRPAGSDLWHNPFEQPLLQPTTTSEPTPPSHPWEPRVPWVTREEMLEPAPPGTLRAPSPPQSRGATEVIADTIAADIDDNERVLEEAERVFMASAVASGPSAHSRTIEEPPPIPAEAAEAIDRARNREDRTLEEFRSSSAAIVQRARALRRDLREFVNRLPGTASTVTPAVEGEAVVSGSRRRRSLSPGGEFDEMTERILRDARRRRLELGTSDTSASLGNARESGTVVTNASEGSVGR